jgi:radical SAM family uncharacterized protein
MTKDECLALLDSYGTAENIRRHCLEVGRVAHRISVALKEAGCETEPEAVLAAGTLHDIARAEGYDHGQIAAKMLEDIAPELSDLVKHHMTMRLPESVDELTDAGIVALADRVVKEGEYVGYEERMGAILARRKPEDYENFEAFKEFINSGTKLIESIESVTGTSMSRIVMGGGVSLSEIIDKVERPGRYVGGEIGSYDKDPGGVALRFCFAFPDLYEIGMSYTGFQILYGLLNSRDDVYCERAFSVAPDMEAAMRAAGLPLFSLETRTPLSEFDMIGFTLQYELSFTNVLAMLDQAGVPLLAAERDDSHPIVFSGGPCTANPEPLADFTDLYCIGDGEDVIEAVSDIYIDLRRSGEYGDGRRRGSRAFKAEFLRRAAKVEGVYVPAHYEPYYEPDEALGAEVYAGRRKVEEDAADRTGRGFVADIENAFFPTKPVVPLIGTVHDRAVVEIMRGCYRDCRFCQAGHSCSVVRRRSPEKIKQLIKEQLANTGYDEVSLLSLSTGDYPGIEGLTTELMEELAPLDVYLSLPSLRLDSLQSETLEKISEYKSGGLTFAPEAGTQRLRELVRKRITEEDIMRSLEIAIPLGFVKFKYYFMIGFPTETDEDIDAIADLAGRAYAHGRRVQKEAGTRGSLSIGVSVSNFVPKPGSPLQYAEGCGEAELLAKIHRLRDRVKKVRGVSLKYHDTRMSRVEMLLSKGDRRTGRVIAAAYRSGCRFDSWREYFDYEVWLAAFAACGVPSDRDLYADEGRPQPWGFIEVGKE